MKIVDKNIETTVFKEIKVGEVFKATDYVYYLKIENVPYVDDEYDEPSNYNAVKLSNGRVADFADYATVYPVDSELIIK